MGTRVNYQIIGRRGNVALTLYSNNSHRDVDPDRLFINTVETVPGITRTVFTLLGMTYPSSGGNHRSGDPIFTVDVDPGDHEYIIRANFEAAVWDTNPRFERLYDGDILDRIPFGMVVDAPETPVISYQIVGSDQSVGAALVSNMEPGTQNTLSDMRFRSIMRGDRALTDKVIDLLSVTRPNGEALFRFDVQMLPPIRTVQARVYGLLEGMSNQEPMFVHGP